VTDQLERPRIVAIDELDLRIAVNGIGQIVNLGIERHGDGALGKRGRDAFGDVEAGDAGGIITRRTVGKGQNGHGRKTSVLSPANQAGKRFGMNQVGYTRTWSFEMKTRASVNC
jgi:hypothetical protein